MNNDKLREADGRVAYKDYQDRLFFIKKLCAMMAQCEPDNADRLVVERDAMILKKATSIAPVDDKALSEAIGSIQHDLEHRAYKDGVMVFDSANVSSILHALRAARREVARLSKPLCKNAVEMLATAEVQKEVAELRKATYELFYRLEEYSVFKLDQPPVTDLLSAADKAAELCGWKAAITATEQSAAGEGKGAT